VSHNRSHQICKAKINEPVDLADATWIVEFDGPCGTADGTHSLGRDEVEQYNADPDLFAAKALGFATADEYREWVECNGAPLCGERTKSGKLCRNQIGRIQQSPDNWREHHRSRACASHGGEAEPPPPTRPPSRSESKYPVADDRRCEALAHPPDYWNRQAWQWGEHRCGNYGSLVRDGRRVCHAHLVQEQIRYAATSTNEGGERS
jgi:hypothetical protein